MIKAYQEQADREGRRSVECRRVELELEGAKKRYFFSSDDGDRALEALADGGASERKEKELRGELLIHMERVKELSAEVVELSHQQRNVRAAFLQSAERAERAERTCEGLAGDKAELEAALEAMHGELVAQKQLGEVQEQRIEELRAEVTRLAQGDGAQREEDREMLQMYQDQLGRVALQFNESTQDMVTMRNEIRRLEKELKELKAAQAKPRSSSRSSMRSPSRSGGFDVDDDDISALAVLGADDALPEKRLRSLRLPSSPYAAAFDMTGRWFGVGTEDGVRMFDTQSWSEKRTFGSGHMTALDIAPTGADLVLGAASGNNPALHLYRADTGMEQASLRGHRSKINAVLFSLDGRAAASGGADRQLISWDLPRARSSATLATPSTIVDMAFAGRTVVATAHHDRAVRLYDVRSMREVACVTPHSQPLSSVTLSPDTMSILSNGRDHTLQMLDIRMNLKPLRIYRAANYFNHARRNRACYSAGSSFVLAGSPGGRIIIWDEQTGKPRSSLEPKDRETHVIGLYWSPDSPKVVALYDKTAEFDVFGPSSIAV